MKMNAAEFGDHEKDGGLDETLRLIASIPVPEGLQQRVQARLRSEQHNAPQGRLLAFPARSGNHSSTNWLRGAAAAAIVTAVLGGGWGVVARIQPAGSSANQAAKTVIRPAVSGGFSSAGAMRTPETLRGPVLSAPAPAAPVKTPVKALVPVKVQTNAAPKAAKTETK
jgi:hypothetical protein